jgi:hypothetical protein
MGTIFGGFIDLVILMATVISGLLEKAVTFLLWLVKLDLTENSVSSFGEVIVKAATFAITYTVVGWIFKTLGWFNSKAMKLVYVIISTVVSFGLCFVVSLFEKYYAIGSIVVLTIFVVASVHRLISSTNQYS